MLKNYKEKEVQVRRRRVLLVLIQWRMALTMRKGTAPMEQVKPDVASSEIIGCSYTCSFLFSSVKIVIQEFLGVSVQSLKTES